MERGRELLYNFGLKILFPRFMLNAMVPSIILLGPGSIAWLAYWRPAFDWVVVMLAAIPFALSVAANLVISRYLQQHETAEAPYEYRYDYDLGSYTPYFRVHAKDRDDFRRVMKSLRAAHKGETFGVWLWLDDNLWLLPLFFMVVFWLLWLGALWLLHRVQAWRRPAPI